MNPKFTTVMVDLTSRFTIELEMTFLNLKPKLFESLKAELTNVIASNLPVNRSSVRLALEVDSEDLIVTIRTESKAEYQELGNFTNSEDFQKRIYHEIQNSTQLNAAGISLTSTSVIERKKNISFCRDPLKTV